ncbi:MAG TPA: flavodoxin domain-containing protein [Candidatus Limnocylindrales bacterium]
MRRALVVYASRHGATGGIAEKIGDVLRSHDIDVVVADAAGMPDPDGFDATVIGSGVYMGSWLKEGTEYLERHASTLAKRPVWLFSSGPLPGSSKTPKDGTADPIEDGLGPAEGPGSGGRRKVAELSARIQPRDHRVFRGAFDPADPPRAMSERLVRMMPAAKTLLPTGDFREWDAIADWAHGIAAEVTGKLPVG